MNLRISDERGSAMVMALGTMMILAVVALSIVAIVTAEKRTGFSAYAGARSFYSADAATEAGVNWMRHQYSPPRAGRHRQQRPGREYLYDHGRK